MPSVNYWTRRSVVEGYVGKKVSYKPFGEDRERIGTVIRYEATNVYKNNFYLIVFWEDTKTEERIYRKSFERGLFIKE